MKLSIKVLRNLIRESIDDQKDDEYIDYSYLRKYISSLDLPLYCIRFVSSTENIPNVDDNEVSVSFTGIFAFPATKEFIESLISINEGNFKNHVLIQYMNKIIPNKESTRYFFILKNISKNPLVLSKNKIDIKKLLKYDDSITDKLINKGYDCVYDKLGGTTNIAPEICFLTNDAFQIVEGPLPSGYKLKKRLKKSDLNKQKIIEKVLTNNATLEETEKVFNFAIKEDMTQLIIKLCKIPNLKQLPKRLIDMLCLYKYSLNVGVTTTNSFVDPDVISYYVDNFFIKGVSQDINIFYNKNIHHQTLLKLFTYTLNNDVFDFTDLYHLIDDIKFSKDILQMIIKSKNKQLDNTWRNKNLLTPRQLAKQQLQNS